MRPIPFPFYSRPGVQKDLCLVLSDDKRDAVAAVVAVFLCADPLFHFI